MVSPEILKLLELQKCDTQVLELHRAMESAPARLQEIEQKSQAVKARLESQRAAWHALEKQRADLRAARRDMEEKALRYRTQQSQVKKNDEYQALGKQIEEATARASAMEEEELGVLFAIDEATVAFRKHEQEAAQELAFLQQERDSVAAEETRLRGELEQARAATLLAEQGVSRPYLDAYQRVKSRFRKPPFVCPIVDHKVQGLRVSNEVESLARKGEGPVLCDNTGRLVYMA